MTFNYTVDKVEAHQLTITYEDGSTAIVPVYADESKEAVEERIATFYFPSTEGFVDVAEVPFVEGETYETDEYNHKPEEIPEPPAPDPRAIRATYQDLRYHFYPSSLEQCYAMHVARKGDSTLLDEVDAKIDEVDATFPEDMEPITNAEYDTFIDSMSALNNEVA